MPSGKPNPKEQRCMQIVQTYIDRPIVGKEIRIGALPAHAGTANRAEGMSDAFLAECVTGQRVKPTDPCDVRLERVDH